MTAPDFKELLKEFHDLESKMRQLRRNLKLRNILRILGIGFIIYKNAQKEIDETLSRRKILLGNLLAGTTAYTGFLKTEMEKIGESSSYLTKDEEARWLSLLGKFREELEYLRSASVLSDSQTSELLDEIAGFHNFVRNHNSELEKAKLREQLLSLETETLQSEKEFNSLYYRQSYFSKRDLNDWKMKWSGLVEKIEKIRQKARLEVDFQDSISRVTDAYREGDNWLKFRNTDFTTKEIQQFNDYFDKLEKKPFTKEQRIAIVTDEVNNLIVAGAGTGKTSTIVGKAGYLIRKGLAKPEEILLLSFNRDVSLELQQKVNSKLGKNLQVNTYHSFGLQVIAQATKTKPSVSKLAEDREKFSKKINDFLNNRMKDPAFAELISQYFMYYFIPYKSPFEFDSFGEYIEYIKQVELRSLKGDKVKSFEECFIANFLYINGIEYEYEKRYEIPTADINHRQYRPDFYLPQHHLYVEHFGIDRNGKPPPFVSEDEYNRQMQWKRDIHSQYKTTLIQTHSYEHKEGTLLKNLEKNLREKGVVFSQIPREQLFAKFNELGRVNQFSTLLGNFLNLHKS